MRALAPLVAAAVAASPARAAEPNPLLAAVGAPADLVLRGSLRTRVEALDGQFRPNAPRSDALITTRLILFGEVDLGAVRFGGELRDARGYAQKRGSSAGVGEINAVEPLQAYTTLDLDGLAGAGSTAGVTLGRFTAEIGSGRLVGRPDFSNSVNSYTGARFDLKHPARGQLTAFWVAPSRREPADAAGLRGNEVDWDDVSKNLDFFGASATRIVKSVSIEGFGYRLVERDAKGQPTRNRSLTTYGARLMRAAQAGDIDFDIEAARQTGSLRLSTAATDLRDVPVRAYNFHAELGRKFAGGWAPRLSVHVDHATGDSPGAERYGRFDPLFGATRSDFGPGGLYGALGRSNLESLGLRVEAAPSKRLDGFVMARALRLDEATDAFARTGVRDRTGASGRRAGTQIEGRVRYWLIPKRLRIEGGAAILAKGRFLDDAPSAPAAGTTTYGYFDISTEF